MNDHHSLNPLNPRVWDKQGSEAQGEGSAMVPEPGPEVSVPTAFRSGSQRDWEFEGEFNHGGCVTDPAGIWTVERTFEAPGPGWNTLKGQRVSVKITLLDIGSEASELSPPDAQTAPLPITREEILGATDWKKKLEEVRAEVEKKRNALPQIDSLQSVLTLIDKTLEDGAP